jgi:putative heme-binding domain-containing protein
VGSKGKVSFFPDRNGDGRADEEKVIASGWKEGFHGVGTVGLAMDPKDGALFFGLGCANFADAYLIDKNTGKAGYDIKSEFGTIQRISPDFSKRESVCTGVRFTCALAFNRTGELFASEQEGATWLPNGNPFDELLHIRPGVHYGFPPRHPKHLPGVRDEPAVVEYGPQHQSTVGMVFNEGVNGGPSFGPAHWAGDVLMCGESRGKLWRTKLARTPLGYVAENHLIACLNLLLVDACVTPQGDLLVACHSGPPDWGTGPAGEGRLYKISYTGKSLPQPVYAWAAAPDEFRIAFDRPLDPADWRGVREKVRIEAGRYVSAGDRFETVRPGYQVVREQMASPRRWVDVLGLSLGADQRTISLRVPPQTEPVNYAIALPTPEAWKQPGGVAQHPHIDVQVSLNGLQIEARGSGKDLKGMLPHPSPAVARVLTQGSAEHAALLDFAAARETTVTMRASVDPFSPFVPTVQPGSKLDWDPKSDPEYSALFQVSGDYADETKAPYDAAKPGKLKPLSPLATKHFASGANGLFLSRADLQHPLSPQRIFVPWAAEPGATPAAGVAQAERTDVKGNWLEGRRLFFGQAACFTCHVIRGEGMAFGPDLSNLIHRDRDSVMKDILQPSATINPDQAGSTVKLKDGSIVQGIVRTANDNAVKLGLPAGAEMTIERAKIASVDPLKTSLMTEGFGERLSKQQQEDLLTFLLINPLEPAPITRTDPPMPTPRTRAEVAAVMPPPPSPEARAQWKPLRILLSGGQKDHGIDEHDYPLWLQRWSRLLVLAERVTVSTCKGFPTEQQLASADVVVFYSNNAGWNDQAAALLDAYQQRGGGLVYLHWGIEGHKHALPLAERAGLAFAMSKFRHGEMDLQFTQPAHPITRGFTRLRFVDESYWRLHGDPKRLAVLASSEEDGAPQPQLWAYERHRGRVFGCIPGHYTWTFDDPLYRLLVLRGIAWAAGEKEVDRLSELSWPGARFQP